MRKSEEVLQAFFAALEAAAPAGAEVRRNLSVPAEIPEAGVLILRDGKPGRPEGSLSGGPYLFDHRADVDVIVRDGEAPRDVTFDLLVQAVGAAVAGDRTLGGLCDWVEATAPRPVDLAEKGAGPIKAAIVEVTLSYEAPTALG
ncbi:MAG: acyl-CoA transferase [Rhodobacteraceae bacterium]|nr:acyl-CoA transferase [Paracoccaceae bacterium]